MRSQQGVGMIQECGCLSIHVACCLHSHSWSTKLKERNANVTSAKAFGDIDGASDPVCVKT